MQHKCRVTVLDKKLYPELQKLYCADPESGACPCYNVGDEYIFERYAARDDFWRMGEGTMVKGEAGMAGSRGVPHCSEAWDAISRYIYTALQGDAIMRGWMNDERVMITCCSDGTRPVIFKLERLDYQAVYAEGAEKSALLEVLKALKGVSEVIWRDEGFYELYTGPNGVPEEYVRAAVESAGGTLLRID